MSDTIENFDILEDPQVLLENSEPKFILKEASLCFNLIKKIGQGGIGAVYLAHDIQLDAKIAVKVIPIADFEKIDQFFDEASKLYLSRHHHIAEVKYACKDHENIYLAMPFYSNGSVKGLMDLRFLKSKEIIRYSLHFLSGLNNIHSKDLLHFDIKPENVLLTNSDQAVISDFGVAQYTGNYGFSEISGTTKPFAPPEYFQQNIHNNAFDIYQAGLALYRMAIGEHVFLQQYFKAREKKGIINEAFVYEAIQAGAFPDRSAFMPHTPITLRNVIKRALHIDPNQRYRTVIDMMNDLSKIDNCNDWQYEIDVTGKLIWSKNNYEVVATPNGAFWDV